MTPQTAAIRAIDYRFGPRIEADGVRFRLWAPDAEGMAVEIEGGPTLPLTPAEDGFLEALAPCGPGARYRFVTAGGERVPDPASRRQAGDVDGPSVVEPVDAFAWRNTDWIGRPWAETVIYELHAGVMGGYAGVAEALPALAALGVTAIELMPVSDFSGTRNWGYDGVLPFAPDSAYGSPDDLRSLIDRAHDLGLMVFLDVVYNHFGPEGNWLPSYAPAFFDAEEQTPWGAAIDFRNPSVRRFFTENVLYWLHAFRFDGLRFDAVHAILDQSWLTEMAAEVRASLPPERHVHLMLENEANTPGLLESGFDAQWNDDFHNVLHVLLTGETHGYYEAFADEPTARLARCLAEGFIYQGETPPGGEPRGAPSGHLRPTAFVSFLQNHDQTGNRAMGERLIALAHPEALRAAVALMLLSPQIPMLFMGEEVGAREPFLFFTDFHDALADAVREGRRREFARAPEFADPERRKTIPDPNALATFEASRWTDAAPDAASWRALYKRLLALRATRIAPHLEGARSLGAQALAEGCVTARWRLGDGSRLTLAVNLGDAAVAADLPAVEPLYGEGEVGRLAAFETRAWIEP
ncbi:MAG: malto-oligosyltrehalose trehalohydrolase [Brevundimonas sp.]